MGQTLAVAVASPPEEQAVPEAWQRLNGRNACLAVGVSRVCAVGGCLLHLDMLSMIIGKKQTAKSACAACVSWATLGMSVSNWLVRHAPIPVEQAGSKSRLQVKWVAIMT